MSKQRKGCWTCIAPIVHVCYEVFWKGSRQI
jgi:hypothetical protein